MSVSPKRKEGKLFYGNLLSKCSLVGSYYWRSSIARHLLIDLVAFAGQWGLAILDGKDAAKTKKNFVYRSKVFTITAQLGKINPNKHDKGLPKKSCHTQCC